MKQIKRLLCIYFTCASMLSVAQVDVKGIKWTTGLSWDQVKQKAKQENKYIFLDCYTTWCPPCKKMDEVVYSDNMVGDYYNEKFISVKVQMDRSKKDDASVQSWYQDAEAIAKFYHIDAYPTFLFLSPQGLIVEKDEGFKESTSFVALAQAATQPGKVYNDPYKEYNQFTANYKRGIKEFNKMAAMIPVAAKVGDKELVTKLYAEFQVYAKKLPKDQRYTQENIVLWTRTGFNSKDPVFEFFIKDGSIIDKVIEVDGFSANVVDKIVMKEIIMPFFKGQRGGEIVVNQQGMGFGMQNEYGQIIINKATKTDTAEADWKKLEKELRKTLNKQWARREVEEARQEWYEKHNNWHAYAINYLQKLNRRGTDFYLNNCAWNIFLHVSDTGLLNQLEPWVKKSITKYSDSHEMDTYANLLYKVGKIEEALVWEKKASILAGKENAYYLMVIEKMKKGEPTWD